MSQASGGRLDLGIGMSHQMVVEGMWGLPFDKPVRRMREYLEALVPLLAGENPQYGGETVTARGGLDVRAEAPPVLVAALGPQMLAVTGRLADGTVTWMTGAKTIADLTAPTIRAAAEEAGRPEPRVVVALPVCVTADEADARQRAATEFSVYGILPSYRAMLDREGMAGPEDLAMIGSADAVAARHRGGRGVRGHDLRRRRVRHPRRAGRLPRPPEDPRRLTRSVATPPFWRPIAAPMTPRSGARTR